jgi:sulfite exporter TauE/SafE
MYAFEATVLARTAAAIACIHALVGVDHSVPFIVLGRARGWSLLRTLSITGLCGAAHVGASVAIGLVGVALGVALERLTTLDSVRGDLAAWLMIAFGLAYSCRAIWRHLRNRRHEHPHSHLDGTVHDEMHNHHGEHLHPHGVEWKNPTVWVLFLIFAFGPCEALIPLMMAPAMSGSWGTLILVVGVFAGVTLATMLGLVATGFLGLSLSPRRLTLLGQHGEALAGLAIATSGGAVLLFGI